MTLKNLLEKDFISHYGLTVSVMVNEVSTNDADFELVDDATLVYSSDSGIAKYKNPTRKEVNIVNYESFINSLPKSFEEGRERCDLMVYTSDLSFFLLNELTKTQQQYVSDFTQKDGTKRIGKRNKAISQLKQTLNDICAVSNIDTFIKLYKTKHCCFFNKPPLPPTEITALTAFNRLPSLTPYGVYTIISEIESYGFEFWEFSTPQAYLLAQQNVKNLAQQLAKLSTKEVKELAEILQSSTTIT
jgi:hypothetical protein